MAIYRQSKIHHNLLLRSQIIQAVRRFFSERQYLEVDTPVRIPAPAPEAHIDAVVTGQWFLQTSPELCMKMLLAAGYPRIFQICKCFRNQERGTKHLPELTMLEWYRAGGNYISLMEECEELLIYVAHHLRRRDKLIYRNRQIELSRPWTILPVADAFHKYGSISMDEALADGSLDEVMAFEIEPQLGAPVPVFLCDYPAQQGALARLKPQDPLLAERFELYVAGLELCNGFSELTNVAEQRTRFKKEQKLRRSLNKTVYPMPHKFLDALGDMPEACGNALGLDRLVMLFADTDQIDDVVAFTPEEL